MIFMARLRVVQTGQRLAFDIIDGPDYSLRHSATAVYVQFQNLRQEGRLRTYANDPRPFGPTIRHYRNISEHFISALHLQVACEYPCVFTRLADGAHLYEITEI